MSDSDAYNASVEEIGHSGTCYNLLDYSALVADIKTDTRERRVGKDADTINLLGYDATVRTI